MTLEEFGHFFWPCHGQLLLQLDQVSCNHPHSSITSLPAASTASATASRARFSRWDLALYIAPIICTVISGVNGHHGNKTKGVRHDIAADRLRRTHCQRQHESSRHRSAGHAAGVKCDSSKHFGHEKAQHESQHVARNQEPKYVNAREHSHEREAVGHCYGGRQTFMPMAFSLTAPALISSTWRFSTCTAGSARMMNQPMSIATGTEATSTRLKRFPGRAEYRAS